MQSWLSMPWRRLHALDRVGSSAAQLNTPASSPSTARAFAVPSGQMQRVAELSAREPVLRKCVGGCCKHLNQAYNLTRPAA